MNVLVQSLAGAGAGVLIVLLSMFLIETVTKALGPKKPRVHRAECGCGPCQKKNPRRFLDWYDNPNLYELVNGDPDKRDETVWSMFPDRMVDTSLSVCPCGDCVRSRRGRRGNR